MAMLSTRQLGENGPLVSAQGLGLMGLSMFYDKRLPDEDRLSFLDYALAKGVTFWDSADVYADNEDILAKWFRRSGKRSDIFLATKFAIKQHPGQPSSIHNSPEYVREACLKSRDRLGLKEGDAIDLYYCHRIDPNQPIEITVAAMAKLVDEGLVKYLGLSECSADTLRRAHRIHPIAAVQIELSPFAIDSLKNGLAGACRELGIAVIPYSPFSRGFLTGKLQRPDNLDENDRRRILPRFSKENFDINLAIVRKIEELALKKHCSVGQLTLAWISALYDRIIPIPGTTKSQNLDENIGSLRVELTEDDMEAVNRVAFSADIQGDRHPKSMVPYLYADIAPLRETEE
ncbi:aldo-keto reductase [Aspergillus costaricaensis CBS 115574]|uniref:Aldo-keto reductase n=1 Tax=Aspergillus costaricaensis CBS 115574 TaxID=1448317 RepID=A0ACD1IFB0_9EURO|nr:aldo-keto reductase [Aspergillus costaricaensis CBS 115574]RAK88464.1 aldo-keto reductase [Aspergillus costaricaensis CBS 115574]